MTEIASVARFSVSGDEPLSMTQTLPLAEKIHLALVQHSGGSPTFTGCDSFRRPLKGNDHAYFFCESNPGQGRGSEGEITHVTIYSPKSFDCEDRNALQRLTRVYGGNIPDVSLSLLALGWPQSLGGTGCDLGQCPVLAKSNLWVSRTPFLPARHPKVTRAGVPKRDQRGLQIDSPEHEMRRLLKIYGFPEPAAVEQVAGTMLGKSDVRWRSFGKTRQTPGQARRECHRAGYGFRIQFPQPVQGPLALGYSSHFGMGSFIFNLNFV
jgi:CRISPR-associated protein Csb2